jgi:hypothetical protein
MTDQPTLRLVRGEAGPEELAALLAVLSAHGGSEGAPDQPAPRIGRWADPASAVRRRLDPGPGAWRASGLPHG